MGHSDYGTRATRGPNRHHPAHLEEDTARMQHAGRASSVVHFNRAGVPLMEDGREMRRRVGTKVHHLKVLSLFRTSGGQMRTVITFSPWGPELFSQHHTSAVPSRRARRRLLGLGAAVLALGAIGAGQFSLALFTDQESVDATFASGSVELDGDAIDQLAISLDPMMPGDSITDDVVIANVGSGDLRYALTTASTNADAKGFRDVLQLAVKTVDATTPLTPCDDFDGTTVMAATALGASSAGFGDSSEGDDTGDRALAAGASETLCFRVQLPLATTSTHEGATTTTTFTFAAEQTANNP